jgi:hypothetical protein
MGQGTISVVVYYIISTIITSTLTDSQLLRQRQNLRPYRIHIGLISDGTLNSYHPCFFAAEYVTTLAPSPTPLSDIKWTLANKYVDNYNSLHFSTI